MENDPIFQPLTFPASDGQEPAVSLEHLRPVRQLRRLGQPGADQLGGEVRPGGIGAIISSFVPVHVRGRILPNYAMIDHDDKIPFWREVGGRVHEYDCKFIMQLSHSGRQRDVAGVENFMNKALSSTNTMDRLSRPALPGGDEGRDHGARAACSPTARAAHARRARRGGAARLARLSLHAVPQLRHQRPHGRVRRLAREPLPLPARGHARHPARGRRRLSPAGEDERDRPQ